MLFPLDIPLDWKAYDRSKGHAMLKGGPSAGGPAHYVIGDDLNHTALTVKVHMAANAAQSKLRETLLAEGFDTIAHITPANWSGVGVCQVLVAYSPCLTRRAIATHGHVGAALPITVLITTNGTTSTIEALDPAIMTDLTGSRPLLAICIDARHRIERALARLEPAVDVIPLASAGTRPRTAHQ